MGVISLINKIKKNGFVTLPGVFSQDEINIFKKRINEYLDTKSDGIVFESDGISVRGIHGLHLHDKFFESICKNKTILEIATKYIGEPCYVHQFKINIKKSLVGMSWPWHEDFIYWKNKDGIIHPKILNICIFIDDVGVSSGPLSMIPKSHLCGELTDQLIGGDDWRQDVSNELTYQIGNDRIEELIDENGIETMLGSAGDILAFDPRIAHSSSVNMSNQDRSIIIITYNAVSNPPTVADGKKGLNFCVQQV